MTFISSRPGMGLGLAFLLASAGALAQGSDASASARGVLRAQHEAVLASSISERIVRMPFREGDRFNKGQVLVAFDCGRLAAELRAARAGQSVEARNAQVQTELLSMDATGRADADIAMLKEKERDAQADTIQARMAGCQVVAPYAGRVVEASARLHETPPPNEKLLRVVSDGPLELHMVVPSRWLQWLRSGSTFDFQVDETGDVLQAKVERISAAVDAVSQTVKVVASVPKSPATVLPGMSGRVLLGASQAASAPAPRSPGLAPGAVAPVAAVTASVPRAR